VAHDVFVSYSHHDKAQADAVCATLEAKGIRCWIAPRDVVPGQEWGAAIVDAIQSSRVMVLVFSSHANTSPQIRREVQLAVSAEAVLIPFRIEDVAPAQSLEYFLGTPHWLDALTPPLEVHLERLATAVAGFLNVGEPLNAAASNASSPQNARISDPPQPVQGTIMSGDRMSRSSGPDGGRQPAHSLILAAAGSKRNRLIALLAVVLMVAAGVLLYRHVLSSSQSGGELVLSGATDPGANAFMPPAASPPPTDTQPPPTLQPQGNGNTLATQPLPGDRDGLYGGTLNNADSDRDKMSTFLGTNPAQAAAFVEALNTDPTLYWSGGHPLTAADIPTYLRELTPALLRLDTRATNHGFDGTHPTTVQSVFQTGTAVLVDAHGVPRTRLYSGSPLTAAVALAGKPKLVGTPWPGYHPGALAEVQPSTATITNFVLVDVVTGQPFNRPAGSTGTNDTPHAQPVSPPQPAPATSTPTTGQGPQSGIPGIYMRHTVSWECYGRNAASADSPLSVTLQGNTVTVWGQSGPLNADGSFVAEGPNGPYDHATVKGVFAMEGGRWVIRDGTWDDKFCHGVWTATKQ
jgi:hypothetical protein